jgi:hypothetical protein
MTNKLLAVAGFLVLALSPSFLDWQQSPEKRWQFLLYYTVGIGLVWTGFDGLGG